MVLLIPLAGKRTSAAACGMGASRSPVPNPSAGWRNLVTSHDAAGGAVPHLPALEEGL